MNSTLYKALTASILTLGCAAPVFAQFEYDDFCIDPSLTTSPYSTDIDTYGQEDPLFRAGMGIAGTVAYKFCVAESGGATVSIRGRPAWGIGYTGTIQDDILTADGVVIDPRDNYMQLTYATNDQFAPAFQYSFQGANYNLGSGSGFSYARIYVQNAAGVVSSTGGLYGANPMKLAYVGASNRYFYTESVDTVNGTQVDARCVVDVLGDTARVTWQLTNQGTATAGIGVWYGEKVVLANENHYNNGPWGPPNESPGDGGPLNFLPQVTIPGAKPIVLEQRWTRSANPSAFPAYCNFTYDNATFGANENPVYVNQPGAYGLQVVNQPIPAVEDENGQSDQTPVDEFVIGDTPHLLDGDDGGTTDPPFGDFIFPDSFFDVETAFLQKWQPTPVAPGQARTIVSYYRNTTGDPSYANGYTGVVDTPKVVSVNPSNNPPQTPNPMTIRVWLDNVGGFDIQYTQIPLLGVQVALQLPQGMYSPGNPSATTITQTINEVQPGQMSFVDFQVQSDPTLFGPQPYTVTITPSGAGEPKIITGSINFETAPYLLLRPGANLVSPPWQFEDATWDAVLSPLVFNQDYQSYNWDPVAQEYVISTGPVRGTGSWIVANNDLGFDSLGGTPQVPGDMFTTGAPEVQLQTGWNLVGNPYTYSIPLGQIVGAINGTSVALSYASMVQQGLIDGAFAYYDQDLQTYQFIQSASDEMLPNYGYWVYAQQPFTLSFPPVYDLFDRSQAPTTPAFAQNYAQWRLQLSAKGTGVADTTDYVGYASNPLVAYEMKARKAPMSPAANAIRAYVTAGTGTTANKVASTGQVTKALSGEQYAELLNTGAGKQTYTYNVFSRQAGPTTITWPNLQQIPTNLAVSIKDLTTNKTMNARSEAGSSYEAEAASQRSFQVVITPEGTVRESIGSASASVRPSVPTKMMAINFNLSSRGVVGINIYSGSKLVGTVVQNKTVQSGANQVMWQMVLLNGATIPSGKYTMVITAIGEGGDTATKSMAVTIS